MYFVAITLYFSRCRNGDGAYQLTQRERALEVHRRLTQTLENEGSSLSSQSYRDSDSYESRDSRSGVQFRRVIRRPSLRVLRRDLSQSHISPDYFPPSFPSEDPQSSSPESLEGVSIASSSASQLHQNQPLPPPPPPSQQRRRLFSMSASPSSCLPRDVTVSTGINASDSHGYAFSPSLDQTALDDMFGLFNNDPIEIDEIIDGGISPAGENEYAFGNLFDTFGNEGFLDD